MKKKPRIVKNLDYIAAIAYPFRTGRDANMKLFVRPKYAYTQDIAKKAINAWKTKCPIKKLMCNPDEVGEYDVIRRKNGFCFINAPDATLSYQIRQNGVIYFCIEMFGRGVVDPVSKKHIEILNEILKKFRNRNAALKFKMTMTQPDGLEWSIDEYFLKHFGIDNESFAKRTSFNFNTKSIDRIRAVKNKSEDGKETMSFEVTFELGASVSECQEIIYAFNHLYSIPHFSSWMHHRTAVPNTNAALVVVNPLPGEFAPSPDVLATLDNIAYHVIMSGNFQHGEKFNSLACYFMPYSEFVVLAEKELN